MSQRVSAVDPEGVKAACARLAELAVELTDGPDRGLPPALFELFAVLEAAVRSCPLPTAELLLKEPEIERALPLLQCLRARYELAQEQDEARRIVLAADPTQAMQRLLEESYPATTLHAPAFQQEMRRHRRCLVIGSGALPITPLLLCQQTLLEVSCLDRSPQAAALGEQVLLRTGCRCSETIVADILELQSLSRYDVVFLTALVGVSSALSQAQGKRQVLAHLARTLAPDAVLCLRSPFALGQLFYPPVDSSDLVGYTVLTLKAPCSGRSNLLIARTRTL